MSTDGMLWWRVELERDGSVKTCERVEYVATDKTVSRVYVQANNAAQAVAKAKSWYERRKEVRRKSDNKRNAERQTAGLCRNCTEKVCARSVRFCEKHLDEANAAQRRWAAGESKPVLVPNPVEAHERQRETHKALLRQYVQLRVVLMMFDKMKPKQFRDWLVAEMAKRSAPKKEAA